MSKKNKPTIKTGPIITKEVKRDLELIAARLPKIADDSNTSVVQRVFGSTLIAEGHTHVQGSKIVPGKKYARDLGKLQVDHYKQLEKAFLRNGMDGVNAYADLTNKKSITQKS